MGEAARCLSQSEAGAKKQLKATKASNVSGNFPAGVEWEILQADAVVLQGLVHALRQVAVVCKNNLLLIVDLVNHIWDIYNACMRLFIYFNSQADVFSL